MYLDFLNKYSNKIQYNHTSTSAFLSGGKIQYLISPTDAYGVIRICEKLKDVNIPYIICGNCTKILVRDGGYKGAFINMKVLNGIKKEGDGYYVQGGASLSRLAKIAKEDGLSGLEELFEIPASIGGAICMNAGAFNKTIADVVEWVDVLKDGDIVRLFKDQLNFKYRDSIVKKEKLLVLNAKTKLVKSNPYVIENNMGKFKELRKATQPVGVSLGSVFKKVDGVSSAYYIEKAGLKGKRIGGAMISNKHANFILNVSHAKSRDFIELAKLAKSEVDKLFKIGLEYEVIIV